MNINVEFTTTLRDESDEREQKAARAKLIDRLESTGIISVNADPAAKGRGGRTIVGLFGARIVDESESD